MSEDVGGRVIVVLGPHRGGTSATTRILNLLGVDLGPEEELVAGGVPQNPKGFFENRSIMLLNDQLLKRLGGTWREPPPLEPGWERDRALDPLRADARGVLVDNFSAAPIWGFKDPRTCITLPFWRDLIGDAEYVICHRNVLEVARSLERRDGLSLRHGVDLWARCAAAAIVNSSGARRIFVGFDEFFSDRDLVLGDLAAFVGSSEPTLAPDFRARADDWLESDLKHHALGLHDVMLDDCVPEAARVLHATLDLAISSRTREPGLRGDGTVGPVSAALNAAASSYEQRRPRSRARDRVPLRQTRVGPASRSDDRASGQLADAPFADPLAPIDFIVIGAAHAGSGTLRDLLVEHPGVVLEPAAGDDPRARSDNARRRGLIWPAGMSGDSTATVEELARWAAASAPKAKLIALLRDPIERAIDHHRLAVARGAERRELERALREQLCPGALRASRERPSITNGYLIWGEYGRILEVYRGHIERSRLLVLLSEELELDPSPVIGRVLRFLDLDDSWRPVNDQRAARLNGQAPRVSPEAARSLVAGLDDSVFPLAGQRAEQARRSFTHVFDSWNRAPSGETPTLGAELAADLQRHFAADARRLETTTGVRVPWLDMAASDGDQVTPPRPGTPAARGAAQPMTAEELSRGVSDALTGGRGFALIRLGGRELRVLADEPSPVGGSEDAPASGGGPRPTAAELRRAIADADAVGVPAADDATGPPEPVMAKLDLQPPFQFRAGLGYRLFGFDPGTGRELESAPVRELLAGLPVAVVGSLADDARRFADAIGYEVSLAVELDRPSQLEESFIALAAARGMYDAVLVAAGCSGLILCSRLARELDVVALDLGAALSRALYARYGSLSATEAESRWAVERYLAEAAEPPPAPPHPLEGELVREPGSAAVFYVERGRARRVSHKALLSHLGDRVAEIEPGLFAELPRGLPVCAVHDSRDAHVYVLAGGRKVPLALGLPTRALGSLELETVPAGGTAIDWFPGAPVGWR